MVVAGQGFPRVFPFGKGEGLEILVNYNMDNRLPDDLPFLVSQNGGGRNVGLESVLGALGNADSARNGRACEKIRADEGLDETVLARGQVLWQVNFSRYTWERMRSKAARTIGPRRKLVEVAPPPSERRSHEGFVLLERECALHVAAPRRRWLPGRSPVRGQHAPQRFGPMDDANIGVHRHEKVLRVARRNGMDELIPWH